MKGGRLLAGRRKFILVVLWSIEEEVIRAVPFHYGEMGEKNRQAARSAETRNSIGGRATARRKGSKAALNLRADNLEEKEKRGIYWHRGDESVRTRSGVSNDVESCTKV